MKEIIGAVVGIVAVLTVYISGNTIFSVKGLIIIAAILLSFIAGIIVTRFF